MKLVIFCHSLVSDWNHGNAHFLRGISTELIERGHEVAIWEPRDGWSRRNLRERYGSRPEREFQRAFKLLHSSEYDLDQLDLDEVLDGADLVLVHEWNEPSLIARIGRHRQRAGGYRLLFHDTHHRAATAPEQMSRFDLSGFDGVLAFGEVIRRLYLDRGWTQRAWTWHEAADTRVFRPDSSQPPSEDLVWVGNWGDGERSAELWEFLLDPARQLRLSGSIYGVRYPPPARDAIACSGLRYRGWLANYQVPAVFARHRLTVHVPRRPYVQALPGIPTIRVFEALACGIPLVCSPWEDAETLFEPGRDYLVAHDGRQMQAMMRLIIADPELAQELAAHGLATILSRHTCSHRVDELLGIYASLVDPDAQVAVDEPAGARDD